MKANPVWRPGLAARRSSRFLIQGLRSGSFTKESSQKTNPLPVIVTRKGFVSRFFGANSVASALDLHPGRDPDAKELKLSCSARWEVDRSALLTHHLLAECQQAE